MTIAKRTALVLSANKNEKGLECHTLKKSKGTQENSSTLSKINSIFFTSMLY